MKQTKVFWQFVFLALALTFCFVFSILFIIWLRLNTSQTIVLHQIIYQNIYYLLALITVVPVALWVIFEMCYTRFYLPLKKIPAEIAVIFSSNPSHRIEHAGNQNIRELSEAINQFAEMYEKQEKNIIQKLGSAKDETESERNLLASIVAELPVGIVICNINGRILLFNTQAKMLFIENKLTKKSEYFIGLGRSIFHIIEKAQIEHALAEIEERLNSSTKRVASYFTALLGKDKLILLETIPVLNTERAVTAFILSLQDMSGCVNQYESLNSGLLALENNLAELCCRIEEFLLDTRGLLPSHIEAVQLVLKSIRNQSRSTRDALIDKVFKPIPLTKIELGSFLFVLQKTAGYTKNIRVNISAAYRNRRILGDMHTFIAALVFLFEKLQELAAQAEFDLVVNFQENRVIFNINWEGAPVGCTEIHHLMEEKITRLTYLGYILKQNRAAIEPVAAGADACTHVRVSAMAELPQPVSEKRRSPVIAGSRPEFYDFNLFTVEKESEDLLGCDLRSLTYSVIDTETTGLDPVGGDEILAIGAVRIVNNRIIHEDSFEQLVNPGRDIPFESYRIHGIDPTMVADKPTIDIVLPRFKRYISKTVILGHDVAFDMKMLRLKEEKRNISISNPVLDTLLLSAMLHPIHRQHDMESIAKRFGIKIIGRHTALGDAKAAAEIFLKLIPLLENRNIVTLQEAIDASKKTYFSRLRY